MAQGQAFMINNVIVTTPDEEVWNPVVIGEALSGTQRRSPYNILEWRKQVADSCHLDWFDYDNTVLSSLVCTPPGELDQWTRYTDVICQQVSMRKRHHVGSEITARFLVNTG